MLHCAVDTGFKLYNHDYINTRLHRERASVAHEKLYEECTCAGSHGYDDSTRSPDTSGSSHYRLLLIEMLAGTSVLPRIALDHNDV